MKPAKTTSNPGIQTYGKPQKSAQKSENCLKDFVVGFGVFFGGVGQVVCLFWLGFFGWLVVLGVLFWGLKTNNNKNRLMWPDA